MTEANCKSDTRQQPSETNHIERWRHNKLRKNLEFAFRTLYVLKQKTTEYLQDSTSVSK